MNWRQTPERVAWLILVTSFSACCVLAVAVPLGVRSYLLHATRAKTAFVTALAGTTQVYPPGASDPIAVTENRVVQEGSRIVTDSTTRALLTILAEGSSGQVLATVQLSQDTAIDLRRVRTPRFQWSSDPSQVVLELQRGRVLLATQDTESRDVRVQLITPQATISLGVGSLDVISLEGATQVRAQSGTAEVSAAGQRVALDSGERTRVATGKAPEPPVSAALNLVLNGTFEGQISPPWDEIVEVAPGLPPGTISKVEEGQRHAMLFSRRAEDGAPNRVGVSQTLGRDVQGYDALTLRFDLKILYQSVPGGGYLATEYPVMADIFYTDVYGKDLHWYQGFYYMDLPEGNTYLPPTGEKIPMGIWYTFESPNLFELLKDTRPARINSIELFASGHDYESLISNVALTVR